MTLISTFDSSFVILWNTGHASTEKCLSYSPPRWPVESQPSTGHFRFSIGGSGVFSKMSCNTHDNFPSLISQPSEIEKDYPCFNSSEGKVHTHTRDGSASPTSGMGFFVLARAPDLVGGPAGFLGPPFLEPLRTFPVEWYDQSQSHCRRETTSYT